MDSTHCYIIAHSWSAGWPHDNDFILRTTQPIECNRWWVINVLGAPSPWESIRISYSINHSQTVSTQAIIFPHPHPALHVARLPRAARSIGRQLGTELRHYYGGKPADQWRVILSQRPNRNEEPILWSETLAINLQSRNIRLSRMLMLVLCCATGRNNRKNRWFFVNNYDRPLIWTVYNKQLPIVCQVTASCRVVDSVCNGTRSVVLRFAFRIIAHELDYTFLCSAAGIQQLKLAGVSCI